jgi:hypothetical protein
MPQNPPEPTTTHLSDPSDSLRPLRPPPESTSAYIYVCVCVLVSSILQTSS